MNSKIIPTHFKHIVFYSFLLAIVGSFISNALLSVATILLVICNVGYFVFYCKFNLFSVAVFTLALLAFASIIWSNNQQEAWQRSIVKLPLLILLLSLNKAITKKQFNVLVFSVIAAIITSIVITIGNYFINYNTINESYHVAKVMPVFFGGDHIRFSWFIVLAMLLVFYWRKAFLNTSTKILAYTFIVVGFLFLHVLAAKTGLLCLYIALFGLGCYYFRQYKKLVAGFLFFCILNVMLLYNFSESFKNRVGYFLYDIEQVKQGNYISGLSDGARILSWKAGVHVGINNPVYGVGFGDLKKGIEHWHTTYHPTTQAYEMFLPTNQFIIYFGAMGIIGLLLFVFSLIAILVYKKNDVFSVLFNLILLIPLITDDSFERQHGVFIFVLMYNLSQFLFNNHDTN